MTYTEMLETLKKLTLTERLALMEAVLHLMREELQQREQHPATYEKTDGSLPLHKHCSQITPLILN